MELDAPWNMHAIRASPCAGYAYISPTPTQPIEGKPAYNLGRNNSPVFSRPCQSPAQCNRSREPGKHHTHTHTPSLRRRGYELCIGADFATSLSANLALVFPAFVPVRVSKSCALGRDAENMQQAHQYHPLGFVADCKTLCTISSPYYLVKTPIIVPHS
ncbi:hypothetical protein LX32DRAFT_332700 [Colletotrichum zoysiae]|uniref:Uncharacterized protein n=1 Tax=Colletotrichum zoysiae TaxID=1216348 RepID=A0AAD9M6C1_9PEZI|nr:hypothetical protein LX32DRAFT_332700 [Colletotrichum zoysiae]